MLLLVSPFPWLLLFAISCVFDGNDSNDDVVTGPTFASVAAVIVDDDVADVADNGGTDAVVSSVAVVAVVVDDMVVEVFVVVIVAVDDAVGLLVVVGICGIKHFQSPSQLASIEPTAPNISKQVPSIRLCCKPLQVLPMDLQAPAHVCRDPSLTLARARTGLSPPTLRQQP